jgi:O-antigen/teichoic acid export membrane protein
MKNKGNSFFFQSVHALLTKAGIFVLVFATGILSARFLGAEGKGIVAFFLAISAMVIPLGDLGVKQSTAYFLGNNHFKEKKILANLKGLYYVTSLLCLLIMFLIYEGMNIFQTYGYAIPLIFLSIIPVTLYERYAQGLLIAKKQIERINYLSLAEKFSTLVLLIGLIGVLEWGVLGVGVSFLIAKIFVFLLIIIWVGKFFNAKAKIDSLISKKTLQMGVVFSLALFIIQLHYRIDMIMLGRLQNDTSLGIYSVGVNVCELLKEIPLSLGLVLFSRSTNWSIHDVKNSIEKTALLARISFTILFVGAFLLAALSRWAIPFLYGNEFYNSTLVIYWLLPGMVILAVFLILNLFVAGQGKPQYSLYAFLPSLFLNVILNYFLIPKYDYLGAAVGSTISYTFATILYIWIVSRAYPISIKDLFIVKWKDVEYLLGSFYFQKKTVIL